MKRILVITYWSLREPLVINYTLPYLRLIRLFLEKGGRILLVTMEKEERRMGEGEKERVRAEFWEEGIEWHPEAYRSFGIGAGVRWWKTIRKWVRAGKKGDFELVHAWGTPAGGLAHSIARRTGKALFIDSFEPHAESMLEVGQWKRKGVAFHTLFRLERMQAWNADAVIATSTSMKAYSWGRYRALHPTFEVKPACVDIEEIRTKAEENGEDPLDTTGRTIGIYAGKFGGIYLEEGTFDMIRAAYELWGETLLMILLSDISRDRCSSWMEAKGIPSSVVHLDWVAPERVPSFLAKADFALNPVKPVPSKRHCTSIKDGEYWAMGLPVLIPKGISDDSGIIEKEGIGVVLEDLSWDGMVKGMQRMKRLLERKESTGLQERIRRVAMEERGFERALNVYKRLYGEGRYQHRPTTILLIAYYEHTDPVFCSALLDYFKGFPEKDRFRFLLLTFESSGLSVKEREMTVHELIREEIHWEQVHVPESGSRSWNKARDLWTGIRKGRRMLSSYSVDLVYSEGFPSAIMGHHVARKRGVPHIVHTYEPHAEYMLEAGIWKESSMEFKITSHYQKLLSSKATTLITGTERMIEEKQGKGSSAQFLRIPSCVDLEHFRYVPEERKRLRKELDVPVNSLLLVYLGKIGGMYWEEEFFDLFGRFVEHPEAEDPYFIILTRGTKGELLRKAEEHGIDPGRTRIFSAKREDIPRYLSAADLAFSGVRQMPSKAYCSPIKHGEYWACGLPVLLYRNVSEDDLIAERNNVGVVMEEACDKEHRKGVESAISLLKANRSSLRERCREVAQRERSLHKAKRLLREHFDELMRE